MQRKYIQNSSNQNNLKQIFYRFDCLQENAAQHTKKLDLKRALLDNNKEVFRKIIEKYPELVNEKIYDGNLAVPVFLEVIKRFDLETVEFLVEKDADIFKKDSEQKNALIYATLAKKIDIAKYLLYRGFPVNQKDIYGKTALIYAIENNYLDLVKLLFEIDIKNFDKSKLPKEILREKYDELYNYPDCLFYQHYSPLSIAAKLNNFEMVKYLVEKRFHPNLSYSYFYLPPLAYAIENNNFELAKFLVENRASIFLQFGFDQYRFHTPLSLATKLNREKFVKYFLELQTVDKKYSKKDLLDSAKIAIENSNLEIFKLLFLEIKKDPTISSALAIVANELLLEAVVFPNNLEIVKFIVENGADLRYFKNSTFDPLQRAIRYKNKDIAIYLIERGIDVNNLGSGESAIFYALRYIPQADFISYLLSKGADLSKLNTNYESVLDVAIKNNCSPEIIELLKQNGAI
ncbi:MAG: ankyrin repeat domain-containing protein [Candidatus Anstonellaceae archaeon]